MKRWTIIPFILLGVLMLALVLAFGVPRMLASEPDAICVQTKSIATPTKQQKANGHICNGGIPRQNHSQMEQPGQ